MSIVCGTSQIRSGAIEERWNNLFPCQKKRRPYAVLFARKSTFAMFEPVQMPPLPLVISVGRFWIVP